jgi:hypothetical protein
MNTRRNEIEVQPCSNPRYEKIVARLKIQQINGTAAGFLHNRAK